MTRKAYLTDVSEQEWAVIELYVPQPKTGGRPTTHERREIMNAIVYVLRSGCAWRWMPHDLPPWSTVNDYFRQWRIDGTWERINGDTLGLLLKGSVFEADLQDRTVAPWLFLAIKNVFTRLLLIWAGAFLSNHNTCLNPCRGDFIVQPVFREENTCP